MSMLHLMRKAALAFTLSLGTCVAPVHAAPPAVQDFTRPPAIDDVVISPSGKRLAVLIFGTNGLRRVGVMDLDPISNPRVVGSFNDADVTDVRWVNDERLVFQAFMRGAEIREGGAGTFAANHDGSDQRQLIAWRHSTGTPTGSNIESRVLPYGWYLHSPVGDGSNDVFVMQRVRDNIGDVKHMNIARLDTRSRQLRNMSYGMPDHTQSVHFDPAHEPRLLTTLHAGRAKVFWREKVGGAWKEVADFDPLKEGFTPWHVEANGQVLVRTTTRGFESIHRFDPAVRQIDPEPLVQVKGFDLNAEAEVDTRTGRLMGLHFRADRPMSYWFDDGLARLQKGIDAALPGRSNRLYCGDCESTRFFVIRSSSDRQPGEYFLFDRKNASLALIGASHPWIDEASQGTRSFHRYDARDGLKIPLYVTHPPGAKADTPLPAVVLVHGGPFVRGADLTWEAQAQFLASRGYRVLEPEFRGSTGYGEGHFKAGWKQWGHAMQDDLADAVQWAAKQGLVDPARVCITGSSYGGYAALMSPIAHPGVYKCAASFAGVTDPTLMYSVTWSDLSQESLKYGFPVLMGDPEKDVALLESASPLKRAAEIKVPVLLAHGGVDRRVPIVHASKFADAAEKAGVKIERVAYPDEGHGFFDPANHANYFKRLERFLHSSLKAPD